MTEELNFDTSLTSNEATTPAETLKKIKELVNKVYSLKQEVDTAEKKFKKAKSELSAIMEGASVYKIEGDECTVNLVEKQSVTVPKDPTKKKALFNYIKENHGPDVLGNMLTINANSFSSWYTKELEAKALAGDLEFKLDMIDSYDYFSLGIRKKPKRKK